MKHLLILLMISLLHFVTSAQNWQQKVGDEWYNDHLNKGLKVGDTMPDIPLGKVINNYTGKEKFSDFRGKLVLLDFWSTVCSPCIQGFPKMERLQKLFADDIQIFIVNIGETQEQIDRAFKSYTAKLPNLPSIVEAKELGELFPMRGAGHQVWIDKNGVVCMRGDAMNNTNEQKIRDVLAGRSIDYLKDGNVSPWFNQNISYISLMLNKNADFAGSFFTSHNNDYASVNGGFTENWIDSLQGTIRDTYINAEVVDFYEKIYGKEIQKNWYNIINVNEPPSSAPYWLEHFILEVKDTFRYTSSFVSYVKKSDQQFIKSRFCYEQVDLLNTSPEKRKVYMLNNLNRHFDSLYGTKISVQKRKRNCYTLIQVSDKINKYYSRGGNMEDIIIQEKGKRNIKYCNNTINGILKKAIANSPVKAMFRDTLTAQPIFIINEAIHGRTLTITLPATINSINELKAALIVYGLDLIPVQKEIKFIVINE